MDRELYLPRVWADDLERRREAGVPEKVAFRTKPQLARRMLERALERALESGVPFGWVTGDEVYGNDRNLRRWLERRDVPHVLAVRSNEKLWAETDKDGDRCGRTGWRLGWRNPAGCGAARATAPRDPGYTIGRGWRSGPEGAGQGVLAAGAAQHRRARGVGLLRLLRPG